MGAKDLVKELPLNEYVTLRLGRRMKRVRLVRAN
jgi:hypothetical protein